MKRLSKSLHRRIIGAASVGLLGIIGCTAAGLDASSQQCSTDGDCASLGFSGYTCSDNVCKAPAKPPTPSTIVTAADAGTGCQSHDQCTADNGGRPAICPTVGQACVRLATEHCEVVGNWRDPNAIFIGEMKDEFGTADAPFSKDFHSQFTLGYTEITQALPNGLPGGPNGAGRPLVMVNCESRTDPALWTVNAEHLVGEVNVPIIHGTICEPAHVIPAVAARLNKKPLIMAGGGGNERRSSAGAGDTSFIFKAYPPVDVTIAAGLQRVNEIEAMIRAKPDYHGGDIKVALVYASDNTMTPAAHTWEEKIRFNGKSAAENGSNWMVDFYSPWTGENAKYAERSANLVAFKPDIIVSAAQPDFQVEYMPRLEAAWPAGVARPYYVAHWAQYGDAVLQLVGGDADFAKRVIILDYVTHERYFERLGAFGDKYRAAYPGNQWIGYGDTYDWFYVLAYGIVAAGPPANGKITGAEVIEGLKRLNSGQHLFTGPQDIQASLTALTTDGRIKLDGTNIDVGRIDFAVGHNYAPPGTYACLTIKDGAAQFTFSGRMLSEDGTHWTNGPGECPY